MTQFEKDLQFSFDLGKKGYTAGRKRAADHPELMKLLEDFYKNDSSKTRCSLMKRYLEGWSEAKKIAETPKSFKVEIKSAVTNGSINPAFRDSKHLAEFCGNDKKSLADAIWTCVCNAKYQLNHDFDVSYNHLLENPNNHLEVVDFVLSNNRQRYIPKCFQKNIINGIEVHGPAEAMHELGIKGECESSIDDICRVWKKTGNWNDFNAGNAQMAFRSCFDKKAYLNQDNCNNGRPLFNVYYGGVAVFVEYSYSLNEPNGYFSDDKSEVTVVDYIQFEKLCKSFAWSSRADESWAVEDEERFGRRYIKWRFWWD